MGNALKKSAFDATSYLAWEAEQAEKHEYVCGEVFAMVGVRREHAIVTLAIGSHLRDHLKGSPCDVFVSDMKLRVAAADAYFYPDVMVTCDARDRQADLAVEHPLLVVEVLSDSTAAFDRGAKFTAYRKLESLKEYLLIDIDSRRFELYRREGDHWLFMDAEDGARLTLTSVGLTLSPDDACEDLADVATETGAA